MDVSHRSGVELAETNSMRDAGLLTAEHYLDATWQVRRADNWAAWARHALLALGAGHLLAGIIFFFAYNWDDLPVLAKFALVEAGIVISALSAFFLGMDRPAGQAFLIGASILTGVLLALTLPPTTPWFIVIIAAVFAFDGTTYFFGFSLR